MFFWCFDPIPSLSVSFHSVAILCVMMGVCRVVLLGFTEIPHLGQWGPLWDWRTTGSSVPTASCAIQGLCHVQSDWLLSQKAVGPNRSVMAFPGVCISGPWSCLSSPGSSVYVQCVFLDRRGPHFLSTSLAMLFWGTPHGPLGKHPSCWPRSEGPATCRAVRSSLRRAGLPWT